MTAYGGIVGVVSMGVAFLAADTWKGASWGLIGVFVGGCMIVYGAGKDKIEYRKRLHSATARAELIDALMLVEERLDAISRMTADEYLRSLNDMTDMKTAEALGKCADIIVARFGKPEALLWSSTVGMKLTAVDPAHPSLESEKIRQKNLDQIGYYASQLKSMIEGIK